jgi:hypothetical protein
MKKGVRKTYHSSNDVPEPNDPKQYLPPSGLVSI